MKLSLVTLALIGAATAIGVSLQDPVPVNAAVADVPPASGKGDWKLNASMPSSSEQPALLAQAASPDTAPPPPTLPGGASSLQESFQDWQVVCGVAEGGRRCSMIQQQSDQRTNQRVLAIELNADNGEATGALILPFGLAVTQPVALKIDEDREFGQLAFSTCIPAGCVVPLNFTKDDLQLLQTSSSLHIDADPDGEGEPISFSVSLKGFAQARVRLEQLSRL